MSSSAITRFADRPAWRGRLHTLAFFAAIPGAVFLILRASHPAAVVAASIYSASVLIGFGTSAGYHRLARSERACRIMQRMDHSTIYLLIAGTYTPVCLLAMPRSWGIPMLSAVGAGAVLGIVTKQFGVRRFRLFELALYPALGWAAVIAAPVLVTHLRPVELLLLVAGGVLYTVGIPVLVRGRPDPWPRTFGYHEIWHACTVAAGACHFAAVGLLVR
jgi:hemolysin III